MKFAVLAMIFAISVAITAGKECSSNKDCEKDECCLAKGMLGIIKGDCKPLAKTKENCRTDVLKFRGKYYPHCPCEEGLTCVPEKVKDMGIFKIKYNERCVSELIPTEAPVDETDEPVEETEEPVEETEEPVDETEEPIDETEAPAE